MKTLFPEIPQLQGETLLLRRLLPSDTEDLEKLVREKEVYRYLPTFLIEKQYDPEEAIRRMYGEYLADSLILGVFRDGRFCGLAEIYDFRSEARKASVGNRLLEEMWGKGISTEALGMMTEELFFRRGIEVIKASTMVENHASEQVLKKNGFTLISHAVEEDWGYPEPTVANRWILRRNRKTEEGI